MLTSSGTDRGGEKADSEKSGAQEDSAPDSLTWYQVATVMLFFPPAETATSFRGLMTHPPALQ